MHTVLLIVVGKQGRFCTREGKLHKALVYMFVILSVKVTRLGKMNTDVVLDLLANIRHRVAMTLCDIMTCISIRSCIPFFPKDLI